MPLHLYHSVLANQKFQPGCSNEIVQFFNHEAVVEDDAISAELDLLIEKGKLDGISRITVEDLELQLAKKRAELAAAESIVQQFGSGRVGEATTAELPGRKVSLSGQAKSV